MTTKTPISILQELMVSRRQTPPTYTDEPCDDGFKCTVLAGGVAASGTASTKKSAKQESAKNCLQMLGLLVSEPPPLEPGRVVQSSRNFVGELNEFASQKYMQYAEYESLVGFGDFRVQCRMMGKETEGRGLNKKDAKQNAAKDMLKLVGDVTDSVIWTRKGNLKIENEKEIVELYQKLTVKEEESGDVRNNNVSLLLPDLVNEEDDSIENLKCRLKEMSIRYTLTEFQKKPCVMSLTIQNTDLCFMKMADSKEEATRKVLKEVLEMAKSGISLNNDLIKL